MSDQIFLRMQQTIVDGAPESAATVASEAIAAGMAPLDAINNGFVPGMHAVGEEFGKGRMFLPDMMASAEAMRAAMAVLDPELKKQGSERPALGTVVLGTTKGDIHEIGKILVGTLLTAHGFRVVDLGVDVPAETFCNRARDVSADIVGVSALLTTTMRNQRGVIEALERAGLRGRLKVLVGGAPVTRAWAQEIGADGYAKDAMSAVALAQNIMQEKTPVVAL
ncbi:MAG TPA: corrinoid protein [Terriglobales bacterium]|nr:corrinoid protein [Terriglobales bacterium]